MDELPADFDFRPYLGGPGLYLGGELVAHACPARDDPGAQWRVCLSPRRPPRYVFLKDEAVCRRYMAAWARIWEAEIRAAAGRPAVPFVNAVGSSDRPSRHPRRRARRKPPIG